MTNRAERREEIKLWLEYIKIAISLAVIGTVLFAGLQWRIANQAAATANHVATLSLYQRITNEWREHLKTFLEKPHLRPYFEEKKSFSPDDPNQEAALAFADIRLDVMDAILTYAALQGWSAQIVGWKKTFSNAFVASPILCQRLSETQSSFTNAHIIPIWLDNCFPLQQHHRTKIE